MVKFSQGVFFDRANTGKIYPQPTEPKSGEIIDTGRVPC
jgi:hypothetical protein